MVVISWDRLWQVAVESILGGIIGKIAVVVAGVLFAQLIGRAYDKWRYGQWRVLILDKEGRAVVNRSISPGKAKQMSVIPEEIGVFLKGLASPFGRINCDLLEDGPKNGMLREDRAGRRRTYTIDFAKNPAPKGAPPEGGQSGEGATIL